MLISVDFDDTLTRKDVQEFVKEQVEQGNEVIVVTSRLSRQEASKIQQVPEDYNRDVVELSQKCGISKIYFTNYADKWEYLKDLKPTVHLDDDAMQILITNNNGDLNDTTAFNIKDADWKQQVGNILKLNKFKKI